MRIIKQYLLKFSAEFCDRRSYLVCVRIVIESGLILAVGQETDNELYRFDRIGIVKSGVSIRGKAPEIIDALGFSHQGAKAVCELLVTVDIRSRLGNISYYA